MNLTVRNTNQYSYVRTGTSDCLGLLPDIKMKDTKTLQSSTAPVNSEILNAGGPTYHFSGQVQAFYSSAQLSAALPRGTFQPIHPPGADGRRPQFNTKRMDGKILKIYFTQKIFDRFFTSLLYEFVEKTYFDVL